MLVLLSHHVCLVPHRRAFCLVKALPGEIILDHIAFEEVLASHRLELVRPILVSKIVEANRPTWITVESLHYFAFVALEVRGQDFHGLSEALFFASRQRNEPRRVHLLLVLIVLDEPTVKVEVVEELLASLYGLFVVVIHLQILLQF